MQQLDKRVWVPDETCVPCHFESGIGSNDQYAGQFTVPRGMVCVLTSISTHQDTAAVTKAGGGAFNIVRGHHDGDLTFRPDVFLSQSWSGSLQDVYELSNAGAVFTSGSRTPGFVIGTGSLTRPCRIILDPDVWQVISGPSPTPTAAVIILDGYMFPDKGRSASGV